MAAAAVVAGLAFAIPATAEGQTACSRYAAPGGSDTSPGTADQPYRTAQKLVDSLQAGEAGCLRAATYAENVKVSRGGTAQAAMTLMSYPGETATVQGRMWIAQGAGYVTISGLRLDGRNSQNLPSPTVNASDVTFSDNEVTNYHAGVSCFVLGSATWGRADRTHILRNRIHNCGWNDPPNNHDHGIYVEASTDSVIEYNLIYGNANRGVQLYPDAQRTRIHHNVIDRNGEGIIFSGSGSTTSSDNIVERNLITNSTIRDNVESWYDSGVPVGQRNVVRDGCVNGGVRDDGDGGIASAIGFSVENVLLSDPLYVDGAAGNFHLLATSPCLALTGDIQAAIEGGETAPAPTPTPTPTPTPDPGSDTGGKKNGGDKGGKRRSMRLRAKLVKGKRVRVSGRIVDGAAVRGPGATVQYRTGGGRWRVAGRVGVDGHRVRGSVGPIRGLPDANATGTKTTSNVLVRVSVQKLGGGRILSEPVPVR